jgi:hypothetical protein
MTANLRFALLALFALTVAFPGRSFAAAAPAKPAPAGTPDRLAAWRQGVKVSPVLPADANGHSLHAYYVSCPESPDGKWVLYYWSTVDSGHEGEIRILERATGKVRVLVKDVTTEDAHRGACQQWLSGGRRVAYHNVLKDGTWVVACVDVDADSPEPRILARGRQIGFGQPNGDVVPVYSPHWNPGDFRDMELIDVATGKVSKTPVTADAVKKSYPDYLAQQFGDKPISIFFPVLSPDGTRVFFKLATPGGGDYRSKQASMREGLICYDLKAGKFLHQTGKWGHPAWHPDSRHILNVGGIVTDTDANKRERTPNMPSLPGSHPSFGSGGVLYASDAVALPFGKPASWWIAGVGDAATGEFVVLHTFDNAKGAKSWRVNHPHPIFSPDGKRLYFNVSDSGRTRLYVAEISQ